METVTYEQMKNLIETYSKDCKCVVSIKLEHIFLFRYYTNNTNKFSRTTFGPVYRNTANEYLYSKFLFTYFDHDNKLCKTKEKIKFDRYLSSEETRELNRLLKDIKDKSFISDKNTTIIDKDHEILKDTSAEIVMLINKYDQGTELDRILDDYLKGCAWISVVINSVDDLFMIKGYTIQFNTYADNPSKDSKVFDYIRLSIPVLKHNMSYDEVVEYIKQHRKEVNNIILNLLSSRLKRRKLPVNILDFKNAKMVLTRQFELVFTVSVKELPNK